MSLLAQRRMEEEGVIFYLDEQVEAIEGTDGVERVKTNKRTLDADLVIMAVGIAPNSDLASEAGLEMAQGGFIKVNEKMQTSDPDIYAGGDCVVVKNLVSGQPGFFSAGLHGQSSGPGHRHQHGRR